MLDTLKRLNSKLEQIEKKYSQTTINNFSGFTDFMMMMDPICTQVRIFCDTANDKDFKQDEVFRSAITRAPDTIFPSKAEILKHHEAVNALISRVYALEIRLNKDGQQFLEGKNESVLFAKFTKELLPRYESYQATQPAPASVKPVSAEAPSPAQPKARDDEGVSFIKVSGFLLGK